MNFISKLNQRIINFCLMLKQYDFIFLISFFAFISFQVTRLILMFYSFKNFEFGLLNFFGVWLCGFVYDLAFLIYILIPMIIFTSLLPKFITGKKIFFLMRQAALLGTIAGLYFIMISEVLFWDEFNVRFNFISVDYLIYRQEVTNNIQESYPMGIIFSLIGALSLVTFYFLRKKLNPLIEQAVSLKQRAFISLCTILIATITYFTLDQALRDLFKNSYQSELAANGPYQFVAAFRNNELSFKQFYATISDAEAGQIMAAELGMAEPQKATYNIYRETNYTEPPKKLNVILVMIESFSSDFLGYFGNKEGLTPHLDELVKHSIFFDQLYATGTRTDRGLEAVTLSIPPTPGRSIVKRIGRESGFCSLGNVFKENGYNVNFVYGGRGYFDNMNAFFSGNGYNIIDETSTPAEEISFKNAWGMADEDLFSQALKVADESHKKGELFFSHIMTTSNHRPFTFPENRIDIPSGSGRNGSVKYTDWAINDLLEKAKKKPWFNDTIFVIVADHQANSAGKVDLPVERYHIPMWFYAPGHFKPEIISKVCSQIDIGPTILKWLQINHSGAFYGKDIFSMKPEEERALIGTYQFLGLYKNHDLAILAPQKKVAIHKNADSPNISIIESNVDNELVKLCITYYQSASESYKNGLNAWSLRKKITGETNTKAKPNE